LLVARGPVGLVAVVALPGRQIKVDFALAFHGKSITHFAGYGNEEGA
jgi:hypothetical protein